MSIPEPSVRSSQFHGNKPVNLKQIPKEDCSVIQTIINNQLNNDWRISSMIDIKRDNKFLTEQTLWIWQRRASHTERSGYLIIRTNGCCVFWNSVKNEMYSLRIQIPHGICSPDSYWICIATICNSQNSLDIEDVIVANGTNIFNELSYSQRYKFISYLCERLSNQPYLGLTIKSVQPLGVGEWLQNTSAYGYQPDDNSVWDIQSEQPGMRRKIWIAPKKEISVPKQVTSVVLTGIDALTHTKAVPKNHNPLIRPQMAPAARYAYVKADKTGPDRYILEAADRERIGYALVRGLIESEKMRQDIMNGANIARIEYSPEYSKYKIVELMKKTQQECNGFVSSIGLFHEIIC
jgi:hypothetical protein